MSSFIKFFTKKEKTDKSEIKIKSKFKPKRALDKINEIIKPMTENDNSFQGCKSYPEDINLDNLTENCYQVCKTCKTDSEAIKNDNLPEEIENKNSTKNCTQECKSFTEEIKFDNVRDYCFELCCTATENISVKSWIIEKTNIFDDILGLFKEFSLYMKCNEDIQLQLEYLKSQRNNKKINHKLYITTLNRLDKIQEPLNVPYLVCCKPYQCTGHIVEISNLTCNTKCFNPLDPKGPQPVPPDAIATCYDKSNERLCGDSTLPYFSTLNDQCNDIYSKIEGWIIKNLNFRIILFFNFSIFFPLF